jgi:type I restriction enzyme, S subunit
MGGALAGKALNVKGVGQLRPYLRTKNVLDGRIALEDVLWMPMTDQEFERFRIASGDVLLNEGQTLELVGRCSLYQGEFGAPCAIQNQLIRFRPYANTSPEYASHLFRYCQQSGIFSTIATQTTSVAHLGNSRFSNLRLLWPNKKSEQIAIAKALTDADNLIVDLERMIAKKQAIKQGMMQQLLTGRTRLPGFTDDWREVKLRDAGTTYGGLIGKDKNDFGAGSASFVTFMEVMAGARLLGRRLERVRVRPGERQNQVQREDVLFNGSSETPEEVALAAVVEFDPSPATYLNSFCFGYRLKNTRLIDPTFLAYFFRSGDGRELVASLAQGATRYNIAKTKLLEVQPSLPPVDEQRAIVDVLQDAESEIEALSVRLTKARAVQTGMMQELLTGGTRLPVEAAS